MSDFRLEISTDICLTELRDSDRQRIVASLNDEEIQARTLRIPFPYRDEDFTSFLKHTQEIAGQHNHPLNFAIRDQDQQLIGSFSFESLVYGHRVEIAYWLARERWGQGIMPSVVQRMCDYAEAKWNIVRFTAHTFLENAASARVLEKTGFVQEGVLRKHFRKNGNFIDARSFARVKDAKSKSS